MIMGTNAQPSLRNIEAFENSVIRHYNENRKKFRHEYVFYEYHANGRKRKRTKGMIYPVESVQNASGLIKCTLHEEESVYRTFEKTYYMYESIVDEDFDLYVRINISTWLNLDLLDAVADQFEEDIVYCNAINSHVNVMSEYVNDLYPRGDMYIFGRPTLDVILKHGAQYLYCDLDMKHRIGVEHVDDCLVGLCLLKGYGLNYYEHIVAIKYQFLPVKSIAGINSISTRSIGFRVKTTPEGMCSGYSWDDNEYRKFDAVKMGELQEHFDHRKISYTGVRLGDIIPTEQERRPTLFVQAGNCDVNNVFWKYLGQKRRKEA